MPAILAFIFLFLSSRAFFNFNRRLNGQTEDCVESTREGQGGHEGENNAPFKVDFPVQVWAIEQIIVGVDGGVVNVNGEEYEEDD